MSPIADGDHVFVRLDFARSAVVRVFQTDHSRTEKMLVVWPNQPANLVQVQHAELPFHRPRHHAAELGESPLLVVIDMAAGLADKLVPRFAVDANGHLIRHRATRHEDCGLFAEQFGREVLQPVASGIDINHIVPHRGVGDELAHRGGGASDRIGAKVDGGHRTMRVEVRGRRVEVRLTGYRAGRQ
jgi:hypothetical protein